MTALLKKADSDRPTLHQKQYSVIKTNKGFHCMPRIFLI